MNYSEEQRTVGVFAARTAPACDSCLCRRGLWFCNADDAFLCQACDASVHSANSLARRHHRVRLNSASSPSRSSSPSSFVPETTNDFQDENATPAWLHGLTRKPRTSRGKPRAFAAVARAASKVESLVPDLEDLSAEENQPCEQEEQLFYCVPILDAAVLSEFCTQPHQIDGADSSFHEVKPAVQLPEYDQVLAVAATPDSLAGFRPTADLDLEEFTSDVEKLLGQRFDDDDAFLIDGLSLVNEGLMEDDKGQVMKLDTASGDLRTEIKEHEHKAPQDAAAKRRRAKILKLDYEAVIAAWSSNGCSPWTGEGPQIDPKDDIWTDFAANIGGGGGEVRGLYQQVAMAAEGKGREARVSRYREKRRTRLFSKKIRYEVRKLNAEKRPRMKGRFVTRAAAAAAEFPAAAVASTLPYL